MASKNQNKKHQLKKEKSVAEAVKERSVFWPIAWGVVFCILAVLLMLGGFNYGGTLPSACSRVCIGRWLGRIFSPVALMFFAIIKFRHEERRVRYKTSDDDNFCFGRLGPHAYVICKCSRSYDFGADCSSRR